MVKINEISKDNSKYTSKELIDNSINSILVNPADRTIWINGNPYGIAFVSSTINDDKHPKHAAILNDYQSNTALGDYSIAIGKKTQATNEAEFACGKYNFSRKDEDKKTIFSIGNGNESAQLNIFETLDNGKIYIEGIGNYDGITIDTDTVSLQDYISSLTGGVGKIWYDSDGHAKGEIFNNYDYNEASGDFSSAFGIGTVSQNPAEAAFGRFNISTKNETIFSVGIGGTPEDRDNALEIKQNGSLYLKDNTETNVNVQNELKSSSKVNYILNGSNFKSINKSYGKYNYIGLIRYIGDYILELNENNNLVFKNFTPEFVWSHLTFNVDPKFISEDNLNKTFNFKVTLRSIGKNRKVRIGFRNSEGAFYYNKYENGILLKENKWKTIQYDFIFEEYAGLDPLKITSFVLFTQTTEDEVNSKNNEIEIKEIGVYDGKYCRTSIENPNKIYSELENIGIDFKNQKITKLNCSNDLGEVVIENGEIKLYDKATTLSDVPSNLKILINNETVKSNISTNEINYNLNGFKLTDQTNYITSDSNYTYIGDYTDDSKKLRLFIDNSSNTYSGYKFLVMPSINIMFNIKFNSAEFLQQVKSDLNFEYKEGFEITSCNLFYWIDYKYLNNNFKYGTINAIYNINNDSETIINNKLKIKNNSLGENITISDNKNYELLNTVFKFYIEVNGLYQDGAGPTDITTPFIKYYKDLTNYIELSSSENSVTINFNDANTDTYELSLKEYINYTHIGKNGLKTVNYIEDKHMQFVATTDGILMQFGNYKLGVDNSGIWYDSGNGQKKQLT